MRAARPWCRRSRRTARPGGRCRCSSTASCRRGSRTASTATAAASTSSRATSRTSRCSGTTSRRRRVRHQAGVVADDGLTLRWIPGSDNSGELGHVHLYVNGESYGDLRPDAVRDEARRRSRPRTRASSPSSRTTPPGNQSAATIPLRGIPADRRRRRRARDEHCSRRAASSVGEVRQELAPGKAAGTVLRYAGNALAVEGSAIDLVVAGGTPPQTTLAFQVAEREADRALAPRDRRRLGAGDAAGAAHRDAAVDRRAGRCRRGPDRSRPA